MYKSVLITGITGFIGKNIAKRFIEDGWKVSSVVRNGSDISSISYKEKIDFYSIDKNSLKSIISQAKPKLVIHLASLFLAQHQYDDIVDLVQSNIEFGTELLEAMRLNDIRKFVNTGTAWQHYNNDEYNPVNLYAATKQAFEMIIKYYQEAAGFEVVNLQLFDTYGRGDTRRKILALLNELRLTNNELAMSAGEQLIDLVHIDDVVEAFVLAANNLLEDSRICGTYAISSQKPQTLKKVVAEYESVMGCKLNILWGKREYRPREVMVPWNNYKLLPGWQARVSFAEGVKRL